MNESLYENVFREISSNKGDIKPSDVIFFSEPLRSALNFVIRLRLFSLTVFAEKLGFTLEQSKQLVDMLIERKLFFPQPDDPLRPGELLYEARLSASSRPAATRSAIDIWKKIE